MGFLLYFPAQVTLSLAVHLLSNPVRGSAVRSWDRGGIGCIMVVQEYSAPNLNGWPDWSCLPSLAEDQVLLGAPPAPPGGPLFPALESLLQLGGWGAWVGGDGRRWPQRLYPKAPGTC